ncbi:MAG: WhiB family transcriptional regulator [Ilumatobacteraceae bacterium]
MSRLELFAVPAWQRDPLCREYPDVPFFPSQGQEATEARAICARCIVRVECLNFALAEDLSHGVFGGMTPAERRRIANPPPPGCVIQ